MLLKRIRLLEPESTITRIECMWLFALCAAVDAPLDADTCAALRSLLRKCASIRAGKAELDDEVVMLNILATISGRYFGQSEN
jgi:survival of motor neuron protein-interacting protein 1